MALCYYSKVLNMACTISISSVTGSQSGPNTVIVVNGAISGCSTGLSLK